MADRLRPNDSRMESKQVTLRGKSYHYLLGTPAGDPIDTIFLLHGFPDLSFGWRFQVPKLLSLNFRLVIPDMLGYGRTDAPEDLKAYTQKSVSDDIAALIIHICGDGRRVILGGHDWGGAVVWRFALWHPHLIKALFSVCTPFSPPSSRFMDLKDLVDSGILPSFRYQLQFRGVDVEREMKGETKIRQFLTAMYGGRAPGSGVPFTVEKGIDFNKLQDLQPPRLVSPKEMDFYVSELSRNGLRGPLNWYRVRKLDFDEERVLVQRGRDALRFKVPALFIAARQDAALPLEMSAGMEKYFDNLTRAEVDASHWALWQAAGEVNDLLEKWLGEIKRGDGGAWKASL